MKVEDSYGPAEWAAYNRGFVAGELAVMERAAKSIDNLYPREPKPTLWALIKELF